MGLYEKVLSQLGAATAPTPRTPRPSAAVVLWRRGEDGEVEVFWVERSAELPFMGGYHAFPGGGLSRSDLAVPVAGLPAGLETDGISPMPASLAAEGSREPDLVPGLLACALRELFEETGVLLVQELLPGACGGPAVAAGQLDEHRAALLAKEITFAELIDDLQLTPDASRLVFAGRWITPPLAPLRFDNRFFLLEWPRQAAFQPKVLPGELARGEWISPAEAHGLWRTGEVIAAPPILHLLETLAQDGPEEGLARLLDPAEADLGPFRRIEFKPGVILLPLRTATLPPASHTNAYLLGAEETVLIDPGSGEPQELERLKAALDDLTGRCGRRLRAIWLTHHHPDHVGGVAAMRQHLGVPVLAHRQTAERLAGQVEVDGELADGQRITLAGDPPMTVRVVHTPGHARGHLCFFDEAGGSLIAGDMVAGIGTIVIDPPEGDMSDYVASLRRLVELGPTTLFPGHGPPAIRAVERLEEYIRHREWREERILEACRDGLTEPAEMLARVYDDVPEAAHPLALRQIEAHLARLRRRGRLS